VFIVLSSACLVLAALACGRRRVGPAFFWRDLCGLSERLFIPADYLLGIVEETLWSILLSSESDDAPWGGAWLDAGAP
jgi:hypothetical protein